MIPQQSTASHRHARNKPAEGFQGRFPRQDDNPVHSQQVCQQHLDNTLLYTVTA